jgi:hypothetical protein
MSLRVTVLDEQTGDEEVVQVPDGEYFILCTAPCHVAHVNAHANGTHVLTVKGRTGGLA